MAGKVRLNKVIELLERGQAVFSCGTVPNGNFDEIAALGQSAYDMIIIETEHAGFDFPTLRHSLQYLLHRKRIVEKGSLQPHVVPLVRIPPYTRERNEWVIKQTLDAGPFGLVLPHLDSVEGAQTAVRAARYPQVPGAADFEPAGERGWASAMAPSCPSILRESCCCSALSKTCAASTTCQTFYAKSKALAPFGLAQEISLCPWDCAATLPTRTWRQGY
jgi:2-keto-3-deoxy-L-rhamnonate aldolase RhmA